MTTALRGSPCKARKSATPCFWMVSLWGDATPALKGYVDQLDRADKIKQGRQAGEILAGRELDGLSDNLDTIQ
ncbi:hypothetical protein ACC772_40155, partial [Rhizobium ruizarguesonis]